MISIKWGFGVVGVLALVGILWWLFNPTTTVTNYPGEGTTIIAFGDSLIEGVGASVGNDLPNLLSIGIGKPIENMGVPGETTNDGLARIDAVIAKDPKLVIVLLGGNDYLKRIPIDDTFQNLETIIDRIHESGAMVLLLGIQGGILGDPFKERFAALAALKGVAYVPNVLSGVIGNASLMDDAVHPNNAGYAAIAAKILPELEQLIEE